MMFSLGKKKSRILQELRQHETQNCFITETWTLLLF